MNGRSCSCINGSMAWACIGWHIIIMCILQHKAFIHHSFKAASSKLVAEPIKIFLSHLVYYNANHKLRPLLLKRLCLASQRQAYYEGKE